MMLLTMAFIGGMLALVLLAEDGTLEDGAERAWINYLADQSRKPKKPRRNPYRYARVMWRPER